MSFRYIDGVIVEYDACPTPRSFTPLSAPSLPRSMRKRADRRAFLYRDRKSEKAVFAGLSDFSGRVKFGGVERRAE